MARAVAALLLALFLLGQTSTSWNMTIPDPIEVLYNATNATRPDTEPIEKISDYINFTVNETSGCKQPKSWLSWDALSYIGCRIKEGAAALLSWLKEKIESLPIIGAIVAFLEYFGALVLRAILTLGLLVYNLGAVLLTIMLSIAELILWMYGVVSAYIGSALPWIPWIVVILFFSTLVESVNRSTRERSLFPLLSFVTFWMDFFERLYRLFEKLFKTFVDFIKSIVDLIKP